MAPIEAPIDEGRRKAGRLTFDSHRLAHDYGQVTNGSAHNSRRLTAHLVTLIETIELAIAHKSFEHALVAIAAHELVGFAKFAWSRLG
jgi:hypothetical protein